MANRWGRTESIALPVWVVALIVSGMVGVVSLTWWGGHNTGLVIQQVKDLAETVKGLADADKVAHAQVQRNGRDIAHIQGRLAMTPDLAGGPSAAGVAGAGGRQ